MRKRVSIAMAVYNGGEYINEQIDSIIIQLQEYDELIISDDNSNDETWNIIKEYGLNDNRIKCFRNPNRGIVSNFQNALEHCSGEYIFYADQDDIWVRNKVDIVLGAFQDPDITVVIHDSYLTDEKLNIIHPSTFAIRQGNTSVIRNIVRLSYIGCCLAFRAELKSVVIPFPNLPRSHDWWTGTVCTIFGKMALVNEPLIYHRMHGNNATPKVRPNIQQQLKVRSIILINAIGRCFRHRKRLMRKIMNK